MQVNPASNIYLHNLTPHGFGREHPDGIQANLRANQITVANKTAI